MNIRFALPALLALTACSPQPMEPGNPIEPQASELSQAVQRPLDATQQAVDQTQAAQARTQEAIGEIESLPVQESEPQY